ncbi:MAG: cupredoxin domain-containing protein [Hyphomicrobiales bacterium]|nr:cupredoxin domain-containing protein [Hyphomicrobiales bacterium]MDE1971592.1 cupredoxin domain-containing protein [Hyphomicrobiales bacterium]MDE2285395.1 cupredoxin domain-containing protein [Hyphomicrobiales bacterium]MDE2374050.1 cupredoxin domain-containing protein [Hyphomicrobiales bacterium]
MTRDALVVLSSMLLASVVVATAGAARAEEPATLALTIKNHLFEPAELHAPAGKPITFVVKNLNTVASEIESDALHFEKVIPAGGEATVHVRPLSPGRYKFFDDFHHATQGYLIVP